MPFGRPRRRALLLGACALAVALLAAGCGRLGEAAAPPGTTTFDPLTVTIPPSPIDPGTPPEPGLLRITGTPSLGLGLLRVAGAEGQFAREGIGARFVPADDEADVAAALAAGDADLAVVSTEQALTLAEDGVPIRIILLLTASKTEDVILAAEGVEGPADLAGRRIAYQPGGDGELVLRDALAEAGLTMDDVEAIPVDGVDPGMPLVRGDVDAAVVTGPQARLALAVDPDLALVRAAGERPGLVSRVLVARDQMAEERPGQLLAIVRAWQDVYLLDRDDPERIGARVGTIQGGDAADALAALEGTSLYDVPQNAVELFPGGEYHDAVVGLVAGLAAEAGWIAPAAEPAALIDGVFAQTVATAS